jgi:hypothetical protein
MHCGQRHDAAQRAERRAPRQVRPGGGSMSISSWH